MYAKTVLDNGMKVITEDIPHSQSVSVGIWVRAGSRSEGEEESGICHFIEHLLFKGTERRSALKIAKEIDSVGGILNAFTGREYTGIYGKVLQKDLPLALDVLSDIFLNSLFDPREVGKERQVIVQEISSVEDTPDDYVHDLFNMAFWGSHPLGRAILGTGATVGTLTRDQIYGYFKRHYVPRRTLLAAAGNLGHEKVVELAKAAFAGFCGEAPDFSLESPATSSALVVKPKELEQVHFCLGTSSLAHAHPQRYCLYVLNSVFGGSMSSRLFQQIREERGLAYSVYSYINAYVDTGSLTVYAGTSQESLKKVVGLILQECTRLAEELIEPDELKATKEQLKGNLLLSMEHTENRMSRLAKNEIYYGKNLSLEEITDGIDRVTTQEVRALASQIFQRHLFAMAVLGSIRDGELTPEILSGSLEKDSAP